MVVSSLAIPANSLLREEALASYQITIFVAKKGPLPNKQT
jgi:hypothetical protein